MIRTLDHDKDDVKEMFKQTPDPQWYYRFRILAYTYMKICEVYTLEMCLEMSQL